MLIYNYIANRQRLRCVLQINERRYINMRIKVYGKSHLEGIAKKTGNPYNFNQVHYLGKARNVEGQAALTLALDPREYPIDRIEVGKEYDVEFDQRGYVIGFSFPGMFHLHNDLAAAVLSFLYSLSQFRCAL